MENASILGASSSVVSHRAFQGLTRNAVKIAPSFFSANAKRGEQRKEKK